MPKVRDSSPKGKTRARGSGDFSAAQLDRLIEQATVDAYGEEEQRAGFLAVIEDELAFPFRTKVLGVEVTVERVDFNRADEIVAICSKDGERQAVPLVDLPLPEPPPRGAEWIAAYRRWARGSGEGDDT